MSTIHTSGNLALDFVGTLNERWTNRVENLHDGEDVAHWLVAADILDAAPTTDRRTLPAALALREALFAFVRSVIDDAPLPEADLASINAAAAHEPPVVRLTADCSPKRTGSWRAGLSAIARDGIGLSTAEPGALKWCADPECTHPFLDRSRGHRRRWCDMAGCGDRAKAAAYRARRTRSSVASQG